jgi:osmoprotectant transport system permease protein
VSFVFAFLGQFGDAIEFIFQSRESVSGGVQVGGLGEIADLTARHLLVSAVAMAAACALGIPLGLWLGHIGRGEFLAISVSNVGRAVPALVLLFFFLAYLGIGFTNVAVVLFLLALPPILTNTYVGVRQVNPEIIDAARGVGMSEAQIVRRVIGAAIVIAVLTLAVDAGVGLIQRAVTPKGIKLAEEAPGRRRRLMLPTRRREPAT